MGRLHEVLAVDNHLTKECNTRMLETQQVFTHKADFFDGYTKTLEMFDEKDKNEEAAGQEIKEVGSTVPDRLEWTNESFVKLLDLRFQKETTNQSAKANLEVDGKLIAADVPVTYLLELEKHLARYRDIIASAPTLNNTIKWEKDTDRGENYYRAVNPEVSNKTKNTIVPIELSKATDKHPAQVTQVNRDVPVGKYTRINVSGRITSSEKAGLLSRIDKLIAAVKQARTRANDIEVLKGDIGQKIVDFINNKN